MKPIIKVTEQIMNKREICKCDPLCKKFVKVMLEDEYTTICESDAERHAFEVLEELGLINLKGIKRNQSERSNKGWTTANEQAIKDWAKKGFKKGDYKILAQMLGKSYINLKRKIYVMRKEGKL